MLGRGGVRGLYKAGSDTAQGAKTQSVCEQGAWTKSIGWAREDFSAPSSMEVTALVGLVNILAFKSLLFSLFPLVPLLWCVGDLGSL